MISDEKLASLPEAPGVYLFRDRDGKIVYVGKAKSIRDRVKSYFTKGSRDRKTERLLTAIDDVSVVLTTNETEAFLLENNLIKENQPHYNVVLKDDKTYISLKLTLKDAYPMLTPTRTIKDDGALYFGPYPHAREVRDLLKLIQSLYPVRRCRDSVFKSRTRPCILFQLEKCPGPCAGKIDEASYRAIVDELVDFLSGRDEKLLKKLEDDIDQAARTWNFEEANAKKERYLALKRLIEKQRVHEHLGKNRDVWGFMEEAGRLRIVLLGFRRGVLIAKRLFRQSVVADPGEAISSFLFQYYSSRPVPDEIILTEELEDSATLQRYLHERRCGAVRVLGPSDPRTQEMVRLAVENLHEPEPEAKDEAFRRALHMQISPKRIEVYDISHSHGRNPSGIMVVFEDFKPKKEGYRVFHIREAAPEDDPAMMAEVLTRRMTDEKIRPLPDLVVLDGGKGQLSTVSRALRGLGVGVDVIAIAKGVGRKRMEDLVYLPGRKNPLPLPKSSTVFKEMVRMRDEAHRFAVSSHRRWKRREDVTSVLEQIEGVGKKRTMLLLKTFASIDEIRAAGVEGLSRVPGITRKVAENVISFL